MFERFKRKSPERQEALNPTKLVEPLGTAAVRADAAGLIPTPEQTHNNRENVDKVRDIMREVDERFVEFATAAQERGLNDDEIKEAVVAAVAAGELPALSKGMTFKGSGQEIIIFHGDPASEGAMGVYLEREQNANTGHPESAIRRASVEVTKAKYYDADENSPFRAEAIFLPQANDDELDPKFGTWSEIIAKLQAGLNTPSSDES